MATPASDGLWPAHTFTCGGVTATVERRTVASAVTLARILAALPDEDDAAMRVHQMVFARIVAQTTVVEGLDLTFPEPTAPDSAWIAAWDAFMRMDGDLMMAWLDALERVDAPPNGREFWPSHKLTPEERKNRASAGSTGKPTSGATSSSTPPAGTETTPER